MTEADIEDPPRRRPPLPRPLRGSEAARLCEILRVDHAGELGAVHIYRGQRAVFGASPAHSDLSDKLETMQAHEAEHLKAFDALLNEHEVRPTLLAPFWRAAGFALGAGTALLGEKAAHACTEAVESVIEDHYAGQVAELASKDPSLAKALEGFRQDELGHRDEAIASGSRDAPAYGLLTAAIRLGCRAAIRISEKL